MKMIETTLVDTGKRVSFTANGWMSIQEGTDGNVLVSTAGQSFWIPGPYEQVRENMNAELETWRY